MAANKLVNGHREALLEWLAAEYDPALILKWFQEREWPSITRRTVYYYKNKQAAEIAARRTERHSKALTTGLALKEERVARLKMHADELEAIKWQADERGRLWNEKAWRETLDDIAKEMGDRRITVDHRLVREEAQRIAEKLGLNADDILAEAERIVASA